MLGGSVVVPVIDVGRVVVKGDGIHRAAVNSPTTFRVSTKASGEASLDVSITGHHIALHYIESYLKWPKYGQLNHCYTQCENKEQKNVNSYEGNDPEKK